MMAIFNARLLLLVAVQWLAALPVAWSQYDFVGSAPVLCAAGLPDPMD